MPGHPSLGQINTSKHLGEMRRYLSIALGSLRETDNHLHHAHSVGGISTAEWTRLLDLAKSARRTTTALLKYVRSTPTPRFRRKRKQTG